MRIRKALAAFTIYALSALIPVALNPHKVDAQAANAYPNNTTDCITGGTYLVTISENGNTVGRGVITLTRDGNFFAIYPTQSGNQGQYTTQVINPYGDTQGAWRCAGTNQIAARAFNFIYPGPASFGDGIGRTDYNATFNPATRTV